jgi:hypothetical protein
LDIEHGYLFPVTAITSISTRLIADLTQITHQSILSAPHPGLGTLVLAPLVAIRNASPDD